MKFQSEVAGKIVDVLRGLKEDQFIGIGDLKKRVRELRGTGKHTDALRYIEALEERGVVEFRRGWGRDPAGARLSNGAWAALGSVVAKL